MIRPKYAGTQDQELYGREVSWPGSAAGYPYAGPAVALTQEEYEGLDHSFNTFVKIFDTGQPVGLEQWQKLLDQRMNGLVLFIHTDRRYSDQSQSWLIYVEYAVPVANLPANRHKPRDNPASTIVMGNLRNG